MSLPAKLFGSTFVMVAPKSKSSMRVFCKGHDTDTLYGPVFFASDIRSYSEERVNKGFACR